MRVIYLITRADTIGGAQTHVLQLSESLQKCGGEPYVITGGGEALTSELNAIGVPFHSFKELGRQINPRHDVGALLALRREIANQDPQLISCHSSKAGVLGRLVGKRLRIPTLFTAHGWAFAEGVPWAQRIVYREVERLLAPLANRIVTVSEADRQLALKLSIASPDRLVTVLNGAPDVVESLMAQPKSSPCKLMTVARLESQKRIDVALDALAQITDHPWHFTIVGDGPLRGSLESQAKALNIASKVSFLGQRNDVPAVMSKHQVFVLPSGWEGFPRTILEAMRSGLPVIASDVGGVREAVENQATGYVIRGYQVGEWASALEALIGDPQLRSEMGTAGRTTYEKRFTLERMIAETFDLYRSVLQA